MLLIVLAAILIVWKAPDAITTPQFWAEDGAVFFRQQFESASAPFLIPYAGYLHAIPRLVAWIATCFPYADVPLFYNIAAILLGALGIAYFAKCIAFLIPPWITLLAIVLPPSNGEEFGTLTNVQWFLQFALFALVFAPRDLAGARTLGSLIARGIAIFLLGLTGPFSIACAVLGACAWAVQSKDRHFGKYGSDSATQHALLIRGYELSLVAITAAIQFAIVTFISPRPDVGAPSVDAVWLIFTAGFQRHWLGAEVVPSGVFALLLVSLFSYIGVSAIRNRQGKFPILACMLAFGALQLLAICTPYAMRSFNPVGMNADRYFFFFRAALWIAIAVLLSNWKPSKHCRSVLLIPIFLALIAVANPEYARRAPFIDFRWKVSAALIETSNYPLEIPLNPYPWKVVLHARGQGMKQQAPRP